MIVEFELCPNCGGDGIGGIEAVCCCRPDHRGDCCGNPVPEPYPCQFCRGQGQVAYFNTTDAILAAKGGAK